MNQSGENFRYLLNTNSKESNGITIEAARMINSEITTHVTRKLDEIRSDLNSQIMETISTAIAEKLLPTIQKTFNKQE